MKALKDTNKIEGIDAKSIYEIKRLRELRDDPSQSSKRMCL